MPRTMQQSKITFVIRDDLLLQATAESEASTLTMAELIRRAIDLYLTQFPPPEFYDTGELLGEQEVRDQSGIPTGATTYPTNKKYSIHINDGLLGELDRYALLLGQSPDEVVNRALVLYIASLKARREAAEAFDLPPDTSTLDDGEDGLGDPSQLELEGLSAVEEPDPDEYVSQAGGEGRDPDDTQSDPASPAR